MKRERIARITRRLDLKLGALEKEYGLLSGDFYDLYKAGELEETSDFIRWASFYESQQKQAIGARR